METKKKTIGILKKILYQTRKGNIEWRELDGENFITDIGKTNLRVEMDFMGIYDLNGKLLESLTNKDLKNEDLTISGMFEAAKKSALKVYDKLNDLEKTLDNFI
ncbi:MAG: hypothetical protein GF404_04685 [candidate division Zixibacteria bacterium]|jgi:hypothetical protein|nr:hypothetical protein [candidate division Zixibacteria bacterium]